MPLLPASSPARLLAIVGPTASGKTELALALAERLEAPILCVDAMQVYRGLDIGTAKPTAEEQGRVPHYGIDLVSPQENFSASQFAAYAEPILEACMARDQVLVLCGGTGLYYRALLEGFFEAPDPEPDLRARLRARAQVLGREAMYAELVARDEEAAKKIHPNDTRRVVRALEIMEQTGRTISALRAGQKEKPWIKQAVFVGIDRNQKVLSERIAKRTNWMYNSGLVEETRFLLKTGCTKDNTALQALGYKECYDYLTGVCSLQESMDRTERGTVQYAKRQRTWFRLQCPTQWISWPEAGDFSEIVNISLQRFAKSGNNIT